MVDQRRGGGGAAARAAAARAAGGGAPLPVRAPRRGGDRAAAARRLAVPDALLPDLPQGGLGDRHAGGLGADAARCRPGWPTDPSWRRAYRAAHDDYVARRDKAAEEDGPGAAAARHAEHRRHAGRGSSACTRWSRTSWPVPGVNPFGREALDALPEWWADGPCGPTGTSQVTRVAAIDCGTNSVRLLIADVDVDRHARPTSSGGWRSSGWARASTRPGGWRPRRWSARSPRCAATRKLIDAARRRRGSGWSPPARPATPPTGDDFVTGVREIFGVEPEVVTGAEEAELSFAGATSGELSRRRAAEGPPPYLVVDIGGGSTEFVVGSDGTSRRAVGRHRCVRLTERHLRTRAIRRRRRGGGGGGRHRGGARPGARPGARRAGAHAGRPGRLGHHGRGHRAGPARLRSGADPPLPDLRGSRCTR